LRYRYKTPQWIPYPLEEVFAFFTDPCTLPHLTPKWRGLRLEEARVVPPPQRPASTEPRRLKTTAAGIGSSLAYSLRPVPLSPIRIPFELTITEFAWNDYFVETGTRMPFPYWEHTHHFQVETRAAADGGLVHGTLMCDVLDYEPPGGAGWLEHHLHSMFIHRAMKHYFTHRQRRLTKILPLALGGITSVPQPAARND
jgi:ligand-binding SRPBCC domain-containing protein